jgi:hypothetical protein
MKSDRPKGAHEKRLVPGLLAKLDRPLQVGRRFHALERLPSGRLREVGLVCRLCGVAPLKTWGPDPEQRMTQRRVPGTNTYVQEIPYALLTTTDYAEIELEVEEPSGARGRHVTAVCQGCAAAGIPDALAEDLYLSDLEQLAIDDEVRGEDLARSRQTLATMAARKAVGIVRR